jgi:hypothetical protein
LKGLAKIQAQGAQLQVSKAGWWYLINSLKKEINLWAKKPKEAVCTTPPTKRNEVKKWSSTLMVAVRVIK